MDILSGLLNSTKILGLASGKLKSLFDDEQLSAIIIIPDPSKTDGPLPGFRLDMHKQKVVVLPLSGYREHMADLEAKPHLLTREQWNEYITLKEQKEHGELQASGADQLSVEAARNRAADRVSGRKPIDPAY